MDQAKLDSIGNAFMNHYYGTFDNVQARFFLCEFRIESLLRRANLAGLYQDASVMSYEGKTFQGRNPIMAHLTQVL